MNGAPDANDLEFTQYGIDIVGLVQYLIDALRGSDVGGYVSLLSVIWNVYSIIAIILSLLFFAGFVYAKIRYGELSDEEQKKLREEERKWAERYEGASRSGGRWAEIQKHLNDDNPNSWKIAVIEADIYLEEVLTNAGYPGATIGEKLKAANSASFTTIQDAWEAHKVRNEVAHIGGDFVLTKRLAQETLMRFERVFREFGAV